MMRECECPGGSGCVALARLVRNTPANLARLKGTDGAIAELQRACARAAAGSETQRAALEVLKACGGSTAFLAGLFERGVEGGAEDDDTAS